MSGTWPYWIAGGLGVMVIAGVIPLARWMRRREVTRAQAAFQLQREGLEARFFELASQTGKPRGLRWVRCDWLPDYSIARDAKTGLLTAFVSVELHFEAIEGGDMEDVAAVGTVRDACAVFHYEQGHWGTGGKALFNMNAGDVIDRLAGQFEYVGSRNRSS